MKTKQLLSAAAALTVLLMGAQAAIAQTSGEATPDKPYKAPGTHDERKAERAEKRKEMAAANKKGELKDPGQATPDAPNKVAGTHEGRKAERAEKRKEMAAANKKGELKDPGEAGEPKK